MDGNSGKEPGLLEPHVAPHQPHPSRTGWRQGRRGKASLQGASGARWPECHLRRDIAEWQRALLVQPSFRAVSSGAQQKELGNQRTDPGNRCPPTALRVKGLGAITCV